MKKNNYKTIDDKLQVVKRILKNREEGMGSEESCEQEGITREVFYKFRAQVMRAGLLTDSTAFKLNKTSDTPNVTVYKEQKESPELSTPRRGKYRSKPSPDNSKCVVIVTNTGALRDILAGLS